MSTETNQPETVWVCLACGKRSKDRWSFDSISPGWDESCMINAVEVRVDHLIMNGNRVAEIREGGIVEQEPEERGPLIQPPPVIEDRRGRGPIVYQANLMLDPASGKLVLAPWVTAETESRLTEVESEPDSSPDSPSSPASRCSRALGDDFGRGDGDFSESEGDQR
jgi:hypothetical protein